MEGDPSLAKVTVQIRRFVPPASTAMTGSPAGIARSGSMKVGIIASELSCPANPADISDSKLASIASVSMPETSIWYFSKKPRAVCLAADIQSSILSTALRIPDIRSILP